MKTLIRGEKVKLSDYTSTRSLEVEVTINAPFEIDFTCFGLNADRKLTDDRYMVCEGKDGKEELFCIKG